MAPEPDHPIAALAAAGYLDYRERFDAVTRRARERFDARDWRVAGRDARDRIFLYDEVLFTTVAEVRLRSGREPGRGEGIAAKASFRDWARDRPDAELAQTFHNSVARRVFGTVGVDPALEFAEDELADPGGPSGDVVACYGLEGGFHEALEAALQDLPFESGWHRRAERVARAARLMRRELGDESGWSGARLEVLRPVFFRNKAAYVVGRLRRGQTRVPLVLALLHPPEGILLDAALITADEASIVFGFTRSYLHAAADRPRAVIDFLHSIMPRKRLDELYTAVGFNRHGKTELYRAIRRDLRSGGRFEPTPGQKGLVMVVFALPSLNVVFKVIRDRFGAPKQTTHEQVRRKYEMVFVRDRVGRLADAQEFEHLELPRACFSEPVLEELLAEAGRTVRLQGDTVVLDHVYTERRVRPLDLYLREAPPDAAERAALDYGRAIKDLAAADIFPGDLLVKNFGVTRHGRVIFYDYDELALVTECHFRERPAPPYPEAELEDSPWFYVGPDDVFPGEWAAFVGPTGPAGQAFRAAHPELFDPAWWREQQRRQRDGELVDFYPYPEERRLGPAPGPA